MREITYTGAVPVDQPGLPLSWRPGETKALDDELAARLVAQGPFVDAAPAPAHPGPAGGRPAPAPEASPEPTEPATPADATDAAQS
ncbi:MAG TPA: hypothetical protein VFE42_20655 [Chloroflexota bacterium]|nr:hypothetical protein [Chloroflexota bacterium]